MRGLAIAGLLLVAGCGQPADPPMSVVAGSKGPSLSERASLAHSKLAKAERLTGSFETGDLSVDWTAHVVGDEPILIHQAQSLGEYGRGEVEMLFDEGALLRWSRIGVNVSREKVGDEFAKDVVEAVIWFDNGTVESSSYTVNEKATALPEGLAKQTLEEAAQAKARTIKP